MPHHHLPPITLGLCLCLYACGKSGEAPPLSKPQFDAAHVIALDASIDDGLLTHASDQRAIIDKAIRTQWLYSIGQMNGFNGAPDLTRLKLTIRDVRRRSDGLYDISYHARLLLAWPREINPPPSLSLIMPRRVDNGGMEAFNKAYLADADIQKNCLDGSASAINAGNVWYYYRPDKPACPLQRNTPDDASRMQARLTLSAQNTQGRSPEYGKIWEDGRLVVTAVFSKQDEGSMLDSDDGTAAYQAMYHMLLMQFGTPRVSSLRRGDEPSAKRDFVHLTFATPQGEVDVALMLVDSLTSMSPILRQHYNERTINSDLVSYSGHSGLGANTRALAQMGHFVPRQYQIFLINGCDTFSYVDDTLRQAHHAANPQAGPDKYFDLITNAMPAYFSYGPRNTMAVIRALINKRQTYRDILAQFESSQRAAVTGEQDNNWPAPF